jgi:hypothetical protein
MSLPASELLSVVNLVERSRLYGASLVGSPVHQSLPMPTDASGGRRVAFLYSRAEVVEPGSGLQIWPPRYVAFLDPADGQLELIRAVTREEFGRDDDPGVPLGRHKTPAEQVSEEWLTALSKLYQSFDVLLPEFLIGNTDPDEELRRQADEYHYTFHHLREEPLVGYYNILGNAFLDWIASVSGKERDGG